METSLTREQVRRVDAIAIEELGIPGVVLMENAGRNAAERIAALARGRSARRVVVFAGPGNNGGDGFVITRHLYNRGQDVRCLLVGRRDRVRGDAAVNLTILERCGIAVPALESETAMRTAAEDLREGDLVVDALLGTGFRGQVREPVATLIRSLEGAARAGVVAVDIPSGLDCDRGTPTLATVRADLTLTFVARKRGFDRPESLPFTGEVEVIDIGTPPDLIARVLRET